MVKKAYQKLCFYPLARVAVFGILLSALLYQFHGLLSAGDELVARVLGWLCLGSGALHGSLLAVGVIRYVIQVQRASCRLRSLPGYVRERLDQELQTGDRINDLYFTSDFLLVYQLQVRSKQGFACIPYPEIGRKILSLKSRMQTVRDTAGEQSRRNRAARQALKKTLSGLPAFFCSLAAVLGVLASIVMAEHFREKAELLEALQFPADAYGALLFYVVMYGGILVMVIGGALLVRNLLFPAAFGRPERRVKGQAGTENERFLKK